MPNIITRMDIELPEHLETIDENGFMAYLWWQHDKGELSKKVIRIFRPTALSETGYSNDNRPDEEVKTPLKIGELEFLITTKPTTKSPFYSGINEEFGNYLRHLTEQHEKGLLRKGYRTIEKEPYIAVDILVEKLGEDLKTLLSGREGIEQKIWLTKPEQLITEVPAHLPLALDGDYESLTEHNARTFVLGGNMVSEGDRRTNGYTEERDGEKTEVKRFRGLLLDESLQVVGEYPESPTAVEYPFDTYTFVHQLEPRKRYSHSAIINAFLKGMPKRVTKKSKIGDFAVVQAMLQDESLMTKLTESGLVDGGFMKDYNPTKMDGVVYVRLQGVIERLNKYREQFSNPALEQNLIVMPTKYKS